ncbi:MAG: universal stress protein, partial [Polaromonas sp.]|nr:universal stress protein [Polaromonas sp.]
MTNESKVLACVDQSHFADYVVDYAAWAARRMEAPLELLHVIDRQSDTATNGKDHSGAIGFDAQEVLLNELSNEDESRSKALRERGRIFLNRLRERAMAAGVKSPDVRQRYGVLDETLV